MDFILSYNNNEMVMPFPVVPNGGISLTRDQDNITFDGVNYELQAIGTMNPAHIGLPRLFPAPPVQHIRGQLHQVIAIVAGGGGAGGVGKLICLGQHP